MGHELACRRAQPWLAGGSSMGSSSSGLPMKLCRASMARTEGMAGHLNTLECHPILAWPQVLLSYRAPGG